MRAGVVALFLAATAHAKLPFDLPKGWQAAPAAKTPPDEVVYELEKDLDLRGTLTIYPGKIADAELETAAAERHAARVKNRVAWGMKAEAGPPREPVRIAGKHAVRWRDRVGGALKQNEQIMTCAVVSARLACVVTIGAAGLRDAAESAAHTILSSLHK